MALGTIESKSFRLTVKTVTQSEFKLPLYQIILTFSLVTLIHMAIELYVRTLFYPIKRHHEENTTIGLKGFFSDRSTKLI